jgi:hypothetical protein
MTQQTASPPYAPRTGKPTRTLVREFLEALSSEAARDTSGLTQLRAVLADKLGEADLAATLNLTLFEAVGAVTLGEVMNLIEGP